MKMNRLIALGLCVVTALSVTALATGPAVPDDFNTVDYVDDMIKALDELPDGENWVIAPNPMTNDPASQAGYPLMVDGEEKTAIPVMVPLRAVAEALGFTVTWNGGNTITVDTGEFHGVFTLGEDFYAFATSMEDAVGATGPISLGVAPYAVGGVTYVPLEVFDILLGNGAVTLENGKIAVNTQEPQPVALPNPYIPCASMDEAAKLAGFSMTLPKVPSALEAWESTMIQAFYGEDGNDMLIRKAVGSEDVSGDYNVYAQVMTVDGVILKGEKDAFVLAIWAKDGYTYSVSVEKAVSQTDMMALVNAVQ